MINTNYTETTHNTMYFQFYNTVNDLPQTYYAISDGSVFISMDSYKGPNGDYYIRDLSDNDGYIQFDHISEAYVEGNFSFKMVKADPITNAIKTPKKTIHLKTGKFRIVVN